MTDFLRYDSPYQLYGLGFSNARAHPHRIALTTSHTSPTNRLMIVDRASYSSSSSNSSKGDFQLLSQASLPFPATKVGWEPKSSVNSGANNERGELLATSGDVLRIWELSEEYGLATRSVLTNSKSQAMSLPPITSFSWNETNPSSIVTCSIDTTATLWDINTSQAVTQLIAHDRAVYDLSWLPQSSDIFVSVGADGSLRAFDLRTLEHSTILYESADDTPLARIAFSNQEQHMLACFGMDANKVMILDMRSPGQPVAELVGHQAALGAIAWGKDTRGGSDEVTGGGWVASCGDDCQVLLYDLSNPLEEPKPKPAKSARNALSPSVTPQESGSPTPDAVEILPSRAWTAESEVTNLAFSAEGDWLGCVSGQRLSLLAV